MTDGKVLQSYIIYPGFKIFLLWLKQWGVGVNFMKVKSLSISLIKGNVNDCLQSSTTSVRVTTPVYMDPSNFKVTLESVNSDKLSKSFRTLHLS